MENRTPRSNNYLRYALDHERIIFNTEKQSKDGEGRQMSIWLNHHRIIFIQIEKNCPSRPKASIYLHKTRKFSFNHKMPQLRGRSEKFFALVYYQKMAWVPRLDKWGKKGRNENIITEILSK